MFKFIKQLPLTLCTFWKRVNFVGNNNRCHCKSVLDLEGLLCYVLNYVFLF